jgi:Na+-transporting NADH:ubiquinone oxidoreductase subunit NqrB
MIEGTGARVPEADRRAALPGVAAEGSRLPPLPRLRIDNRYLAPLLVTLVLLAGQVSYGFLESGSRTCLAIATAIATEMALGRACFGRWPHLASSYITGISVGMLIRSPELWPYALCSALSISSKYVLRLGERHLWNPSNFGVVAMLVLASDSVAALSVQWGNDLLPMAVVWIFGAVIVHRLGRLHVTATYVASFLALSLLRAAASGHPWLSEVAPLTGPMYQLFIFFMITDPRTSVRSRRGQCLVAFLVAVVEALLRLLQLVHAPYYALFVVGPAANLVEIALTRRQARSGQTLR